MDNRKDRGCDPAKNPLSSVATVMSTSLHRALCLLATSGFGAYVGWWCFWLFHGRLPPAPLKALTGLPAATTGCTRSLLSLMRGDVRAAILWNPFSILIVAMFLISIGWLAVRLMMRRKLLLPSWCLYAWMILLSLAWAAKLLGDPRYW